MGSLPYPNQQIIFQQHFESVRRDEVVGVLFALFFGCFGLHHFYLGRVGLGILYCCFCWTGIPAILGVIECFFMPSRVRAYNGMQAAGLAAAMGIGIPAWAAYPNWTPYPAPVYASPAYAQPYQAMPIVNAIQTTQVPHAMADPALTACLQCGRANPTTCNFCSICGTRLS